MSVCASRLFGRRRIFSGADAVTRENVEYVFAQAIRTHHSNRKEIDYLARYYKGEQPILLRAKNVRPEINNRLVENRANQIVSFKTGYLCGEPIQYVGRRADQNVTEQVTRLNDMMAYENKAWADQALVEWSMICGTSYRLITIDPTAEPDEAPFEIYTLDPRDTFVVYGSDTKARPLMGVVRISRGFPKQDVYCVYTENSYYELVSGKVEYMKPHTLGAIPIIEYPANNAQMGAFEAVLPLLDALNEVGSNRLDGVEQFVQAFMKFVNCEIDEAQILALRELGAVKVKSFEGQQADVDLVTNELNQDQVQTYTSHLYQSVLTICGMPNRNGGSSTSDTGAAVIMRDGWEDAEARAKASEEMFKMAERQMLRVVLRICRETAGITIKISDIDMKFTRRNYENIQTKAQVLTTLLQSDKVHPKLAFEHCGMFADAENAYAMSKEWAEEQEKKIQAQAEAEARAAASEKPSVGKPAA